MKGAAGLAASGAAFSWRPKAVSLMNTRGAGRAEAKGGGRARGRAQHGMARAMDGERHLQVFPLHNHQAELLLPCLCEKKKGGKPKVKMQSQGAPHKGTGIPKILGVTSHVVELCFDVISDSVWKGAECEGWGPSHMTPL